MSDYYCTYCSMETNEWVCHSCNEYKGIVALPTQTNREAIMNRYEVHTHVVYMVDAVSATEAYSKIEEGAEFPVVPYDDNTYCNKITITDVVQVSSDVLIKGEQK